MENKTIVLMALLAFAATPNARASFEVYHDENDQVSASGWRSPKTVKVGSIYKHFDSHTEAELERMRRDSDSDEYASSNCFCSMNSEIKISRDPVLDDSKDLLRLATYNSGCLLLKKQAVIRMFDMIEEQAAMERISSLAQLEKMKMLASEDQCRKDEIEGIFLNPGARKEYDKGALYSLKNEWLDLKQKEKDRRMHSEKVIWSRYNARRTAIDYLYDEFDLDSLFHEK